MFSKQHHKAIAQLLKLPQGEDNWIYLPDLIEDIISLFEVDNPNFDGDRFRKAVGII